jgi:hypothetical protein
LLKSRYAPKQWFERLPDDRLKLTVELGPLQIEKRLEMVKELENFGLSLNEQSKLPSSRFTRLASKAKVISDWNDEVEVYEMMGKLFNDLKIQDALNVVKKINKRMIESKDNL